MIVIVDYGIGNVGSIGNMLKKIGATYKAAETPEDIAHAEKLILPGVGSFDSGVSGIRTLGFWEILCSRVAEDRIPILGICLGMQLLTKKSEEGCLEGFGWIDAETTRFDFAKIEPKPRVPHMGWNSARARKANRLIGDSEEPRFYFVHSYHVVCKNPGDVLTTTFYGYEFVSAFSHGNITGVQFHPEKSHRFGMAFLANWATC